MTNDVEKNIEPDEYADSTVAMSVYNVVCRTSGEIERPESILDSIRKYAHPNLGMSQLRRVVRRMVRSGLLVRREKSLAPCDRKRRVVVQRDRSDCWIDDKGRIRGGWNGWLAKDLIDGLVPLEPRAPKCKREKTVERTI